MNKLFGITLLTILVSCGGGGGSVASSGSSSSAASGAAPTGNFASQVDPVQATE